MPDARRTGEPQAVAEHGASDVNGGSVPNVWQPMSALTWMAPSRCWVSLMAAKTGRSGQPMQKPAGPVGHGNIQRLESLQSPSNTSFKRALRMNSTAAGPHWVTFAARARRSTAAGRCGLNRTWAGRPISRCGFTGMSAGSRVPRTSGSGTKWSHRPVGVDRALTRR